MPPSIPCRIGSGIAETASKLKDRRNNVGGCLLYLTISIGSCNRCCLRNLSMSIRAKTTIKKTTQSKPVIANTSQPVSVYDQWNTLNSQSYMEPPIANAKQSNKTGSAMAATVLSTFLRWEGILVGTSNAFSRKDRNHSLAPIGRDLFSGHDRGSSWKAISSIFLHNRSREAIRPTLPQRRLTMEFSARVSMVWLWLIAQPMQPRKQQRPYDFGLFGHRKPQATGLFLSRFSVKSVASPGASRACEELR